MIDAHTKDENENTDKTDLPDEGALDPAESGGRARN